MFSFFDVIILLLNGKIQQIILGTTASEQYLKIIASPE